MLFRERVAVYCENRTEHTHTRTLCGQNAEFHVLLSVSSETLKRDFTAVLFLESDVQPF
jgi:hypothetical protein